MQNFLEIHFTNSQDSRGPDHIVSVTSKDLKNLRNELDRVKFMLSKASKRPYLTEYNTWRLQKKDICC